MSAARQWFLILAINVGLAATLQAIVPGEPKLSDRNAYEYAGQHGLDPNCGFSVYCYRFGSSLVAGRRRCSQA